MLRYLLLVMTFSFFIFANIPPNTYTYNDKNRLITVTTPTQTVEFTYDANDNRIAKTTSNGITTYLVDANTPYAQVITESKANGTTVAYTYGNDLLSDGSHNFLTDALGSTRGLVDSTETLTDSYAYTPYGKLVSHDGNATNSFLFTGEQFDSETDEYFLRARYYSPNSGRFISRDTYDGKMNDPITLNHYLYAGANPSMYVDPSGNFFSMAELSMTMNIMSYMRTTSFTWGSRAMATSGVRSLLMRLTVRTLQPLFRTAGRLYLKSAPRGKKLSQFIKFKTPIQIISAIHL